MIPQQLNQKVTGASPFLNELKKNVSSTLSRFADSHNFPLSGRVKTIESVGEKIEMGRYNRFSEIDDLVAFTLIIPTATYEQEVIDFCKASFDVVAVRDKATTQKAPDVFRFDSTRVIAKARRPHDLIDHGEQSIFDYLFEVQIRTAFEHAWVVATHDLVYKTSSIDWKRFRLAAQLKATSEGLDAAMAAFDQLAMGISESPWDRIDDQISVSSYVVSIFDSGRMPSVLKPVSISRFSENFCNLTRSIQPKLSVRDAIHAVDNQLNLTNSIPQSLSLYQLFLGLLCQAGRVRNVQRNFCHITTELIAIFPETKILRVVFDYDS